MHVLSDDRPTAASQRPLGLSLMEAVPDHFSRMLGLNRTLTDLDLSKCAVITI